MQLALPRFNRPLLASTSALIGAAALLFLAQPAHAAFDPSADTTINGATTTIHNNRLPDTGILSNDMPSRPLYAPGSAPAPLSAVPYVSPLEPIKMPRPLYPSRAGAAQQPMMAPTAIAPVVASPAPQAPVAPAMAAAPQVIAPAPVLVATPIAPAAKPIALAPAPKPVAVTSAPVVLAPAAPPIVAPAPILAAAPVMVTPKPIAPAPMVVAAPAMPNLPPVDAATAARANAIMQAEQKPALIAQPMVAAAPVKVAPPMQVAAMAAPVVSTSPGTLPGTFIAPAPVLARPPVATPMPAPVAANMSPAKPVMVAAPPPIAVPAQLPATVAKPIVMAAPAPMTPAPVVVAAKPPVDDISPIVQPDLSSQSREMLSHVPSRIDSPVAGKTTHVKLDRVSPQIQQVLGKDSQEQNYESAGISITVRRPGLDTNYELNSAYNSLMGGDTQRAIQIYKNILGTEPRNEDALFGLAATYHRLGMESQARPYYANLLKINPNHREALNNFLVLVSNESPADALPELERLELRNPDFSPIPAQIAIVYDKLGYPNQAREKMIQAIDLAPENLTYKYNLAIMLDRQKHYADAVALYRVLIQAALNGEQVPASIESMEKRLNYITTAATEGRLGS